MNIFVLSYDPEKAARYQVDKHVVKMVLETAQLLCSPFDNGKAPYRRTHYNHPCSKWARESKLNYEWLVEHGLSLSSEYTRRYNKHHKSTQIIEWCRNNINKLNFHINHQTPFAQAMPDDCKRHDAVEAYRTYYKTHKIHIATWTNSTVPYWFN